MRKARVMSQRVIAAMMAVSVCTIFLTTSVAQCAGGVDGLRAGAVKIDITPQEPVQMAGYASRTGLSTGVHDPLSVRVVAFENKGKRLILVSTDVLGFYDGTAEYLRKAVLDEFKLQASELFLAAIHTHSAPTVTIDKEKGHPNNIEYTEGLKAKLIEVIRSALAGMAPARIGVGVGHSPVGANRRERKVNDAGESSIVLGRNPYGPTDKEVLVMKVTRAKGTMIAAAFDYATHSTCLGGRNYVISGDVLGLAEQFVEGVLGQNIIAPAFAGASGDIDPWFRVLPEFNSEPGWTAEPVLLGTMLGEEVVQVFRNTRETAGNGEIRTAFETLQLPAKAQGDTSAERVTATTPLNVAVGRVDDVAFVGIGCEVLTEIGMAIKAGSPCKHTFVVTHCNGAAGYLAPAKLHSEGGYEIRSSPFAPQAADIVVKRALEMLR